VLDAGVDGHVGDDGEESAGLELVDVEARAWRTDHGKAHGNAERVNGHRESMKKL
jgi:hypothetical protein